MGLFNKRKKKSEKFLNLSNRGQSAIDYVDRTSISLLRELRGVFNNKAKIENKTLIYSIISQVYEEGYISGFRDGYVKKLDESL